ncbi:MAG: UrcA family protein [Gammaproteobacteria bacterium]|nr:UrcA family protein [Gammaproteobacteria bacterium]
MNKLRTTAGAIVVAAMVPIFGLGVAHAASGNAEQAWQVRLYVDRSKLETHEGIEAVHARIQRAARQVCRDGGRRSVQQHRLELQCRDEVMMQIALAIDSEPLLALAESRLAGRSQASDAS